MRSLFLTRKGDITTIDALPVLTETGKGAQMAFFDGVSVDSTEELAGTWCGDLLQILEALPVCTGFGVAAHNQACIESHPVR